MLSSFASSVMNRCALAGVLAFTALAGYGCVDEQDHLTVTRAVWYDSRDNCVLSDTSPEPLSMTADVSFQTQIGMGFVIVNNQVLNTMSNTGIDDSEIQLKSADVTFAYSGGAAPAGFNVPIPTNSIAGGNSNVTVLDIPTSIVDELRTSLEGDPGAIETLEMTVVFKGQRTASAGNGKLGEVETRPFTYPIEICSGCLSYCVPPNDSDEDCAGVCPSPSVFTGVCGYAQGMAVVPPGCEPA